MVSLLQEVRRNLSDVRHYGPRVLFRHLARLRSDRIARINVPHVGPVLVRSGDSDMHALRQVFSGQWIPYRRGAGTSERAGNGEMD